MKTNVIEWVRRRDFGQPVGALGDSCSRKSGTKAAMADSSYHIHLYASVSEVTICSRRGQANDRP